MTNSQLLSGNDLSELVKGFLSKLELESAGNSDDNISQCIKRPEISSPDDYNWFKALRFCPRELIDLVNSKACRGLPLFLTCTTSIVIHELSRGNYVQ